MKKSVSVMGLLCMVLVMSVRTGVSGPATIEDMKHENGKVGHYYALLFGIDTYQDKAVSPSKSASKGARELAELLGNNYGFKTDLLLNEKATKTGMIQMLEALAVQVGINDTVMIYFSGRGDIDPATRNGYWYPYDATSGETETYLANETIQQMIRDIKANHIVLVCDSVYADLFFGSSHRLPETFDDGYYLNLFNKQSRWGLTSGTDGPKDERLSAFTSMILAALKENQKPQYTLQELYEKIKPHIRKESIRPPRCRSLKNTGDFGGEPIFILKQGILDEINAAKTKKVEKKEVKTPIKKPLKNVPPRNEPVIGESTLSINIDISDVDIRMDGVPLGKGPVYKRVVSPGIHLIELRKEGYEPYDKNIIVKRGMAVTFNAELNKVQVEPTKGSLIVNVNPAHASIRATDVNLPYAPNMVLEKGVHTIEVSAPFYDTVSKDIEIVAAQENTYAVTLSPVKIIKHKNLGNFVMIPAGEFTMGSPVNEAPLNGNEKQHNVTFTHNIYMQEKELTVGQWRKFILESRYKTESETGKGAYILVDYNWFNDTEYSWGIPGFDQNDNHPVVCVSWNDAQAFIAWLNKKYKAEAITFRLPTEAEWEYACRAGSTGRFSFGTCLSRDQANFDGNVKWEDCPVGKSSQSTVEIGSFKPNAWGLYDMHGNVMEWCQDWLGTYSTEAMTDPKGPQSGTAKVVRGGGWTSYAYDSRSAKRLNRNPHESYSNMGFRLVLEPSGI